MKSTTFLITPKEKINENNYTLLNVFVWTFREKIKKINMQQNRTILMRLTNMCYRIYDYWMMDPVDVR